MKLRITDEDTMGSFLAIFQLLKPWGNVIECKFSQEGMHIQLLSQSKTCIARVELPPAWFQHYEFRHNAPQATVAIAAGTLVNVLSVAAAKYTAIELSYVEHADTIHVHLCSDGPEIAPLLDNAEAGDDAEDKVAPKAVKKSKTKAKPKAKATTEPEEGATAPTSTSTSTPILASESIMVDYELPLMQMEEDDELGIPDLDYDVGFTMGAKNFYDLVHNLSGFGDTLRIRCDDTSIELRTTDVSGAMRLTIPIGMVHMFEGVENEVVDMGYRLSIINKLCLSCKIAEHIHIRITKNMPIIFRYELGDRGGLVEIFAAPVEE